MNYLNIYEGSFSVNTYSYDHHIQYDYVIEKLLHIYDPLAVFGVVDIGSGRGQLIHMIRQNFKNAIITSVDLAKFHNVQVDYFIKCDLSNKEDRTALLNKTYDVLVCTDVLEHLDKKFILDVIDIFSRLSDTVILAVANHSDILNNIELHTIQEENTWWDELLLVFFSIVEYRQLYNGMLYLYYLKQF